LHTSWQCGWIHWRHLANTVELVLPSTIQVHNPNGQIDRFSHFCTAHGRKFLYFTMGDPFSQTCPLSWGICIPIKFMIRSASPSPQSKRHHDRFSCFRTGDHRVSLYFTMVRPFPPQITPWGPSHGRPGSQSNTWFPGPT